MIQSSEKYTDLKMNSTTADRIFRRMRINKWKEEEQTIETVSRCYSPKQKKSRESTQVE